MIEMLAVLLAACSALLFASGRPNALALRLRLSTQVTRPRPAAVAVSALSLRVQVLLCGMAGVVVGGVAAGVTGMVSGVLAAPLGWVWLRRRQARRTRLRREGDVAEACLALAGELGAGAPTRQALAVVSHDWPDLLARAAGRTMIGGDPAAALRESARQPGAEALTAVAAAWEVSERTGAALSSVLTAVADSLRAEATVRREADAQLASVRATSRLMALLPVATLILFSAGDGGAIGFLTGTPYGLACVALAGLFVAAGLFWVDRTAQIVRSPWQS